jgi:hypothetical protein
MSELFTFEPSEFQIIEDMIEFDETIQRPEPIRFFTLDEQVGDAYEKLIPRGRTTKFALEVLKKEVDKLRSLYLDLIVPTADTYLLREPTHGKVFSWIRPVYASADVKSYSYDQSWIPLYEEARLRTPQFYRSMITALPKPFQTEREGTPYPITSPQEFVNTEGEDPIRAVPTFTYSRTQRHEDGRFDILEIPMANTSDSIHTIGYYAEKRPYPIPNPLVGHPFLKSADAVYIESTAPLSEIVPSLDAVLTHGVPVTSDPYGEGMKYLKLYDIKLADIPWNSWKSRFPPVEVLKSQPEPTVLEFPKSEGDKPSEKLLKYYNPYYPAESTRQWLMDQLDGGELLIHMLLSQVGQNGTVGILPGSEGSFEYPKTTIEECELMGLDFQDFSIRGTLRRNWDGKKFTYQCVPLELIKQERKREGHKGRIQWKEQSPSDILETYVKNFESRRPIQDVKQKDKKGTTRSAKEIPKLRKDILAILEDRKRLPEDKLRDVQELIHEAVLDKEIYVDSNALFLLCRHSIAILEGDLARDSRAFYDVWTSKVDGFRACTFCGEHVTSQLLEDQEDFSDGGRVIKHAETLQVNSFKGLGITDHVKSLSSLKTHFEMARPSDEVFFMLISLLHVVPEIDRVLPILDLGRRIATALKDYAGIAGIAQMILLMQSHIPALVPRRSFGSKPLTLSGYPRDAAKPEGYTILDSMVLVLSKTLEAYPTSFKGSSVATMRLVLNAPSKVKTLVQGVLDSLLRQSLPLRESLEQAKAVIPLEVSIPTSSMIPGNLVVPSKEAFGTIISPPVCPSTRVYWTSARPPKLRQPEVPLRSGLNHFLTQDSNRKLIQESVSERVTPVSLNVKDKKVLERLKMGKTMAIDDWHTNTLLLGRLTDAFAIPTSVRSVDSTQKKDDLRDITKGYVYELLKEISKDPLTQTKLNTMIKSDVALVLLTADLKTAKQTMNTLRAKERITFTDRLRLMTDTEREITKDLIDRGLAPTIITREDRALFAREMAQTEIVEDPEVGVGRPIDFEEQGEVPITEDIVERGQYGDYSNAANNDGRDYTQPDQFDEEDLGI